MTAWLTLSGYCRGEAQRVETSDRFIELSRQAGFSPKPTRENGGPQIAIDPANLKHGVDERCDSRTLRENEQPPDNEKDRDHRKQPPLFASAHVTGKFSQQRKHETLLD